MSSVQLIFVFLRSVLRSRTELAAKNLVFTNAAQPTTEVQSRWTSAPFTGFESQVITLSGITIPYFYFRTSENTKTDVVFGQVGHESGQSGSVS